METLQPELRKEYLFHLLVGEGLHPILQPGKRREVGFWKQVRPAGEHLAHLYIGRPHRLQVIGKPLGGGFSRPRLQLLRVELIGQRHLLGKVGATVLPEQSCDLPVPFEMGC